MQVEMDESQLNMLLNGIQQLVMAQTTLTQAMNQTATGAGTATATATPGAALFNSLPVSIPTCKGQTKENVVAWQLQVQNVFHAKGITNEPLKVHYAATGLQDTALHWYLNKVKEAGDNAPYDN